MTKTQQLDLITPTQRPGDQDPAAGSGNVTSNSLPTQPPEDPTGLSVQTLQYLLPEGLGQSHFCKKVTSTLKRQIWVFKTRVSLTSAEGNSRFLGPPLGERSR